MKIAVSHYSYFAAHRDGRMNIGQFIHEAARIGAEGVELLSPLYRDPAADKAMAKQALGETGLAVPIFSVGNNFAKPSELERADQLEQIRFGISEAVDFGASVVRVFAGDLSEGIQFDDAQKWIVEGLALASSVAADAGVKLALENHGKLAGRGDQIASLIEAVREKCGNEALGANPDFGNFMLVDECPCCAITQVSKYAVMAHAKDFGLATEGFRSLEGKIYQGTVIGEGEVPIQKCIDELKSAGFDGWLSVEYEGTEDPLTAVPRSVSNLERMV
ncbi:MAG: sugar phosphate isomerase/epimerase family protein [Fimbriimonadaceae bacterium]